VESVIDSLIEIDALEDGPASALDFYEEELISPLGTGREVRPRPVVFLGDEEIAGSVASTLRQTLGERLVVVPPGDEAVESLSRLDTDWLHDALAFEEELASFEHWRGAYVVYAVHTVSPVAPKILNRIAGALRFPWLHAALDGPFIHVGPTFVPRLSSCFECFETRLTMNLRDAEGYARYKRAFAAGALRGGRAPILPVVGGVLGSLAAFEAANFLLTERAFTVGKVLSIHLPTMELAFHEVLRLPGCAGCGSTQGRDEPELHFDLRAVMGELENR
jgi:bacteriocin biosynthesis cyclodehydratase domain-containing protein